MATFKVARWVPAPTVSGRPRRERRACEYRSYIPDLLGQRDFVLFGREAADVADAERAIVALNSNATALVNTEAMARILLRAESVASSRIEGLEVAARRLLAADAARELGEPTTDVTAGDVLANIKAMEYALEAIATTNAVTAGTLLEIHRRLFDASEPRTARFAGQFRTVQNWIGGSDYNPCSADFVPPPPDKVQALVSDLCAFCNNDDLPAVAQAAIAHAQFETIHPFVDGNGRVGRALIHMILRKRGIATNVSPPISLILATLPKDYVRGLTATRYDGSPKSEQAVAGLNAWIGTFAAACKRAVSDAFSFEERISAIQKEWRHRLGAVRAKSATDLLIQKLPGAPTITVNGASKLIKRTGQATNEALRRLQEAGIVHPAKIGRRNRVFEAREIIAEFTALERQLASASGDTRTASPARRVPYRPTGPRTPRGTK